MKKLFALVMVLAMALAIAVPALASGWDQITTEPATLKNITVEITALEVEANTSVLGSLYEKLATMYPVVKGTDVHFYVLITIPKSANLSQANQDLLTHKGLNYALTVSDNLDLNYAAVSLNGAAPTEYTTAAAVTASALALTINSEGVNANGYKVGIEYKGEGNAAGDATVKATISFNNVWNPTTAATASDFKWDNDADGIDEYVVHVDNYSAPTLFTIYKGTAASGDDFFTFPVDSTGKINTAIEMTMGYGGTTYYINRAVNGDITFRTGATVITPDSTTTTPTYATLKTAFDSYFTALGFGYADAKYMTPAHFTTYFGTISKADASITYPSGTVVVTEPTVNPPQTGDASTVVGFVMIALALVAAAAVTVKKVRA